jgi:hypothetical protein
MKLCIEKWIAAFPIIYIHIVKVSDHFVIVCFMFAHMHQQYMVNCLLSLMDHLQMSSHIHVHTININVKTRIILDEMMFILKKTHPSLQIIDNSTSGKSHFTHFHQCFLQKVSSLIPSSNSFLFIYGSPR